jgi:ABC-2 type transport system ATP-binding protein
LLIDFFSSSFKFFNTNLNFWLDKFEIGSWKNKRIEELSKGMAQKVQFICAILHQPNLLILDEPFSGFDPVNVELIQNELISMKNDGKTILLSSHNMKSVEDICDRAALIHQSKKILDGQVVDIREERKDGRFAIKFKGNMLGFANALWAGFELVEHIEHGNNRHTAYVKLRSENTFQDLLKVLLGQIEIEAAWEVLPSMQQIFIDLVKRTA